MEAITKDEVVRNIIENIGTSKIALPFNQLLIKAGLKAITENEIYDRLGCRSINKGLIKKTALELNAEGFYKVSLEENEFTFSSVDWIGENLKGERKRLDVEHCRVENEQLKGYANEEIPDRCLRSVQQVIDLGGKMEQFYVHYPVIEKIPQKDPIITYNNEGKMFDIDMWE